MRLREHPAIGEGRTDILPADPRKLSIVDGYNVRDMTTPEARAELDELKAQIRQHGVRTPLVVRFDGANIWIVEGHRRHKVALELIAEYEASNGAEGRNIDFIPIKAETPGTSDVDRDFGLETSNSGARLKPLELANLIYRLHTQRGLPLEEIATGLGKSLIVVKNHLAMRAMPEPVKQQVRDGDVSPTLAAKLVKEQPEFAAELIRKNKEENERLNKGKGKRHKVTATTIKRDRPKPAPKSDQKPAEAPKIEGTTPTTLLPDEMHETAPQPLLASGLPATPETEPKTFTPLSDETPPAEAHEPHPQLQTAVDRERGPSMAVVLETVEGITPRNSQAPSPARDIDRAMFAIISELATIAEGQDLNERDDNDKIEVPAGLFKRADRIYRERIGDTSEAA